MGYMFMLVECGKAEYEVADLTCTDVMASHGIHSIQIVQQVLIQKQLFVLLLEYIYIYLHVYIQLYIYVHILYVYNIFILDIYIYMYMFHPGVCLSCLSKTLGTTYQAV